MPNIKGIKDKIKEIIKTDPYSVNKMSSFLFNLIPSTTSIKTKATII